MHTFRSVVLSLFFGTLAFGQSNKLYIFSTDYNGATPDEKIVAMDTDSFTFQDLPITGLYQDSSLKTYNNRLYVIERYGSDVVKIYNAQNNYQLVNTVELDANANPQDIGFVSPTKAYITQLNKNDLVIFNPMTGVETGTISLSAYAVGDNLVDTSKILVFNHRAYVLLQNLVNFQPVPNGAKFIVINTDNDTVIQSVDLPLQNPVSDIIYQNNFNVLRFLIACAGSYGVNDGGFVGIPYIVSSNSVGIPEEVPPSEGVLNGDLADLTMAQHPSITSWYSITDSKLLKHVGDNNSPTTITSSTPYSYADVLLDETQFRVYLANRGSGGSIQAFDSFSNQNIAINAPAYVKPSSLALGKDSVTSTNVAPNISSFEVAPNPVIGSQVNMRLSTNKTGKYAVQVFSVGGQWIAGNTYDVQSAVTQMQLSLPGSARGTFVVALMYKGVVQATKKIVVQ